MSNGEVCCILGVCCPAGSSAQRDHLVALVQQQRPAFSQTQAEAKADKILKHFKHFDAVVKILDADGD